MRKTTKAIYLAALTTQIIGIAILFASGFSGSSSEIAFWVVVGAGIVEVALALLEKRRNDVVNG